MPWRRCGAAMLLLIGISWMHLPYLTPGGPFLQDPGPAPLLTDEGTLVYDSYRTAIGETLYRDFFEFQGPVPFYLLGSVLRLTGPSMAAARALFIVITSLNALLVALIVARFCGWWAGVAAAVIHATAFVPQWPVMYASWVGELWILAALAVLIRRTPATPWSDCAVGILLGLAVMTIQSLGLPALVATLGVAGAAGVARRNLRATATRPLWIMCGTGGVIAAWLLYFAAHGALGDMVYAMAEWPFTNYLAGQGDVKLFGGGITDVIDPRHRGLPPWARVLNGGVLRFDLGVAYLLPVAAVATVVAGVTDLARGRAALAYAYCPAVALATMTPLYLGFARRDITHLVFLGGVTLCGLLSTTAIVAGPRLRKALTPVMVGMALLGAVNYGYKHRITVDASRAMGTWRATVYRLPVAGFIDEQTAPDATIVVARLAGFYYLYVRRSASPLTLLYPYYTAAQVTWMADRILREAPEMLYVGDFWWAKLVARRPELALAYVKHQRSALFTVWIRRGSPAGASGGP